MRKKIGLFVIVGILMNVGVASADRGFWYSNVAGSWTTIFNITNTGSSQTATVTFYDEAGVSLGSTSTTLGTNAVWNFTTSSVGTITASTLEAGTRGTSVISGGAGGEVRGHTSIFKSTTNSGFQMRMRSGTGSDTNIDY